MIPPPGWLLVLGLVVIFTVLGTLVVLGVASLNPRPGQSTPSVLRSLFHGGLIGAGFVLIIVVLGETHSTGRMRIIEISQGVGQGFAFGALIGAVVGCFRRFFIKC